MSSAAPSAARLSERQTLALTALVAGKTQEETGAAAGVTGRTIRAWLQEPAFQRALMQARANLLLEVGSLLQTGCRESVDLLRAIVADETARPHARIAAARTLMTMSLKVGESCDAIGRRVVLQAENTARLAENAARQAEAERRGLEEREAREYGITLPDRPNLAGAAGRPRVMYRQDRVTPGVDGPFDPAEGTKCEAPPQTSSGIGCPPDRIGIGRPSRSGNSCR